MTRTAEGGYGLGMLERISLLSFAFRLFGWAGLGSQRCNTTYLLTAGKIRYLLARCLWLTSARYKEECRCLPNRLASVLNLARPRPRPNPAGGHYGQGFLLGNLRHWAPHIRAISRGTRYSSWVLV